jgi:hypothetical protein
MIKRTIILIAGVLVTLAASALADPILRWSPSDAIVELGQEGTVSVILDDTLEVRTIELFVQFDPAIVGSVSGGPGALFDGFQLFDGFEAESADTWHGYSVILGADDWTVGPGELWSWTVEGLAEGISPVTTVSVTLLPPGGGDYTEVELTGDQITVVDPTASLDLPPDAPRLGLYPNPFNPRTRVELLLPGGGHGRLEVVDLLGRVVDVPWSGVAPATAPVTLDWTGRDRGGSPLPSGVYTFRLVGDRGRGATARGTLVR